MKGTCARIVKKKKILKLLNIQDDTDFSEQILLLSSKSINPPPTHTNTLTHARGNSCAQCIRAWVRRMM